MDGIGNMIEKHARPSNLVQLTWDPQFSHYPGDTSSWNHWISRACPERYCFKPNGGHIVRRWIFSSVYLTIHFRTHEIVILHCSPIAGLKKLTNEVWTQRVEHGKVTRKLMGKWISTNQCILTCTIHENLDITYRIILPEGEAGSEVDCASTNEILYEFVLTYCNKCIIDQRSQWWPRHRTNELVERLDQNLREEFDLEASRIKRRRPK